MRIGNCIRHKSDVLWFPTAKKEKLSFEKKFWKKFRKKFWNWKLTQKKNSFLILVCASVLDRHSWLLLPTYVRLSLHPSLARDRTTDAPWSSLAKLPPFSLSGHFLKAKLKVRFLQVAPIVDPIGWKLTEHFNRLRGDLASQRDEERPPPRKCTISGITPSSSSNQTRAKKTMVTLTALIHGVMRARLPISPNTGPEIPADRADFNKADKRWAIVSHCLACEGNPKLQLRDIVDHARDIHPSSSFSIFLLIIS